MVTDPSFGDLSKPFKTFQNPSKPFKTFQNLSTHLPTTIILHRNGLFNNDTLCKTTPTNPGIVTMKEKLRIKKIYNGINKKIIRMPVGQSIVIAKKKSITMESHHKNCIILSIIGFLSLIPSYLCTSSSEN